MTSQHPGGPDLARRTLILAVAAAVVAAPAVAMRLMCIGNSCDEPQAVADEAPFCSLPADVRRGVTAGFRDGRSPDVVGVTVQDVVVGDGSGHRVWAIEATKGEATVPLVFSGTGVARGAPDASPGLEDVAPTIAEIIGLRRPHPEVRSGEAIRGVVTGEEPRLVVVVAWKGLTHDAVAAADTPVLDRLAARGAAFGASLGSLPVDPAAAAATIGTGGVPRQHGVVGRFVRNDDGEVVGAWSNRAPTPVIAALGDDLDETHEDEARIGVVSDDRADRGLIGGTWYGGEDDDDVRVARGDHARQVRLLLESGYGDDDVVDLLGVAASGSAEDLDAMLERIVAAARSASDSVLFVVAGTGGAEVTVGHDEIAAGIEEALAPVVERVAAGGLFLDHDSLAEEEIGEQRVADALLALRGPRQSPLFADAFPGLAVSFGRYC